MRWNELLGVIGGASVNAVLRETEAEQRELCRCSFIRCPRRDLQRVEASAWRSRKPCAGIPTEKRRRRARRVPRHHMAPCAGGEGQPAVGRKPIVAASSRRQESSRSPTDGRPRCRTTDGAVPALRRSGTRKAISRERRSPVPCSNVAANRASRLTTGVVASAGRWFAGCTSGALRVRNQSVHGRDVGLREGTNSQYD